MKKVIATSLSLAMLLGLSACGGRSDDTPIEKPSSVSAHTTEPTTSDVIEYDPLERISFHFDRATIYPYRLTFYIDYSNFTEDYDYRSFINAQLVSADKEKVVIEATLNKNEIDSKLKDTPYRLVKDSKTFELKTDDLTSMLMNTDVLSDELLTELNNDCKKALIDNMEYEAASVKYDSNLNLSAIYASIPSDDTVFFSNEEIFKGESRNIIDNESDFMGKYGVWFVYQNKDNNYFVVTIPCLQFKKGLNATDYETFCTLPNLMGIVSFHLDEMEIYDSKEKAKEAIESYLNSQLEELPIPDSLK